MGASVKQTIPGVCCHICGEDDVNLLVKNKNSKLGVRKRCKTCHSFCTKLYYRSKQGKTAKAIRNSTPGYKEKRRKEREAWRQEHPEEMKQYKASYKQRNLEKVRATQREWARKNRLKKKLEAACQMSV